MKGLFPIVLTLCSQISWAADVHTATVTSVQGEVKLFTNPGETMQGPGPHALYEKMYYTAQDAKTGMKVEKGNILRTALSGRTQVVYDNGDQFVVGPGTAYKINWEDAKNADSKAAASQERLNLMYGKLRGVIEKGGPRSGMTIRTRSATMGVRGTDFFIAETGGTDSQTEVVVMRGEVSVTPVVKKETDDEELKKETHVRAGYTAVVTPSDNRTPEERKTDEKKAKEAAKQTSKGIAKEPAAEIAAGEEAKVDHHVRLISTTQEHLIAVQKSSHLEAEKEIQKTLKEEAPVDKTVRELKVKAAETEMKDIKKSDPELFAQLTTMTASARGHTAEELNAKAVENLMKTAPKAAPIRKPYKSELDDLENGEYEKYFKILDK